MEEAIGLLLLTLWRIILYIIFDIVIHLILYAIGFVAIKVFTLGHYPSKPYAINIKSSYNSYIALAGFIFSLVFILLILCFQ